MNHLLIYGPPIASLLFLVVFAAVLLAWQARSSTDRGKETKEHSERIYKDFDMYLKVVLGLTAAFGYIRFEKFPELARQGLWVIGAISLLVMIVFCIFIICHQGSKVRRWENIEWGKAIFWQELWACLAMWFFSSGIWFAARSHGSETYPAFNPAFEAPARKAAHAPQLHYKGFPIFVKQNSIVVESRSDEPRNLTSSLSLHPLVISVVAC